MQFVLGRLGGAAGAELGRHLATCPGCQDLLSRLNADTALAEALHRLIASGSPGLAESLAPLLKRVNPTGYSDETAASDVQTSWSFPDVVSFLEPPRGPGELGWLGPYCVLRVLGTGGMGIVYRAEDAALQRPVALKVMRPEMVADLGARQRFLREARAAAQIRHENVVTIYQVGQHEDIPYLAIELLEGESLEDRLRREGRLPIAEVARIGRQIADGLQAAHSRGVIHRDIKPANLWLEPAGGECRVKILDFGLARPGTHGGLTATGVVMGTPKYMAPEQARGETVDHRADLFSLGCVLYQMASGKLAFDGPNTMAVLTALAVDEPPPLDLLQPTLPLPFIELVARLLAKKAVDRPESAAAVADELRSLATEDAPAEPSPAAPRSPSRTPGRGMLIAGGVVLLLLAGGVGLWLSGFGRHAGPPVKVGVLQSLSGTLADNGSPVVDATVLAVEEINRGGGVLGRPLVAYVRDGESDEAAYAREAEKLLAEEKVPVLFGCYTSSSRKAVVPVVEKHNNLLLYPLPCEGLEQSPNVVYCGGAPNQVLLPAAKYAYGFLGKRKFFLVGSDYVYPRVANAILADELRKLQAEVIDGGYVPLGSGDVSKVVAKVRQTQPDVILSTVVGDSNRSFFRALRAADVTTERTPVISFGITETELRGLSIKDMAGDYLAWNYFQEVDRPENKEFVRRFRERFGSQRGTCDPMESAYTSVHLWARAVEAAKSLDPKAVREAIRDLTYDAPGGVVRVDAETLYTWNTVRLGRIAPSGRVEVVWGSEKPVRPEPFPSSRTRPEWEVFLDGLHRGWGGRWAAE